MLPPPLPTVPPVAPHLHSGIRLCRKEHRPRPPTPEITMEPGGSRHFWDDGAQEKLFKLSEKLTSGEVHVQLSTTSMWGRCWVTTLQTHARLRVSVLADAPLQQHTCMHTQTRMFFYTWATVFLVVLQLTS